MQPLTEFRTLAVTADEPADRAAAGIVVGLGDRLDLGAVDTTDEARDTPVRIIWWRVTDMAGNSVISNIRVWISAAEGYTGANAWFMDITDLWTRNRSAVSVKTGSPGAAPIAEPDANLERMGGGIITGTGHDQTSRYIYLAGTIGVNETTGDKTGLIITVAYDYH